MAMEEESVVVRLSGRHSQDALSRVMHVLGSEESTHKLLDFGQMVVRDRFISTAVLRAPGATDVVKEVLFRAHESGFTADFNVGGHTNAPRCTPDSEERDYVLTLFSPGRIDAQLLAGVTDVVSQHGARITGADRLSGANDNYTCFELGLSVSSNVLDSLQHLLFKLGREAENTDMALQRADVSRKAKRMAVFDLSWTLVQCDAIDVILDVAGRHIDESTARLRQEGKLDDGEWTRRRVRALKGVEADDVNKKVKERLVYTEGARELCRALKQLGCKIAVVSSGSRGVAEIAKADLGLDYAFGNVFEMDSQRRFTGDVRTPLVDANRKAELVQMLAMQERIGVEQMIVIADGPVSAKMLQIAGLSIAFDQPGATSEVRTGRIASKSLASVLYLLGLAGIELWNNA